MHEDRDAGSSPSQNNEFDNSAAAYVRRAARACSSGDDELGLHLYLAAYEQGSRASGAPDPDAAHALRKAWVLAVRLKERSLAEYIFEKLEPLLDGDELSVCAEQLQRMALDKLEEFGLSREDLQEMTDIISQDFLGIDPVRLMKVEHVTLPAKKLRAAAPAAAAEARAAEGEAASADAAAAADPADVPEGSVDAPEAVAAEAQPQDDGAPAAGARAFDGLTPEDKKALAQGAALLAGPAAGGVEDADAHASVSTLEHLTYQDIPGFDRAVATMRDFGVGMQDDPQFKDLVSMLNARYGLDRMPVADSFLFRAPAREDAHRFMTATLGEIGLPAIRMRMEENLQGLPVLCVMAQADNHPKLSALRNSFEGPGVLLLEDLDLWISPEADPADDMGGFMMPSLSRGAREAIALIRSAVESPDVYVLASASDAAPIDGFFCDLLEPMTVVDIDYPDERERADIWLAIARDHPSLRSIDRARLVRLSAGMPRFDIHMAVREAIEEAYKASLVQRRYVPVSAENLYEKLAAYQPLDSEEYRALENAVVDDFRRGLDDALEDLLKGEE